MRFATIAFIVLVAGCAAFYAASDYRSDMPLTAKADGSRSNGQAAAYDGASPPSDDGAAAGDPVPPPAEFQPGGGTAGNAASPTAVAPRPGSRVSDVTFLMLAASLKRSEEKVVQLARSAEETARHGNGEVARAAQEADTARVRFGAAERSRQVLSAHIARVEGERSELQARLRAAVADLAARTTLMAAHDGKAGGELARAREGEAARRAQLDALQGGLSAKATELASARAQVAASTERIASLEAQAARLTDDADQARSTLASASRDKQSLAEQASAQHARADASQADEASKVQALAKERDDLRTRLTLLGSGQAKTLAEMRQSRDALRAARERIASQDQDLDALHAKAAATGKRNVILRSILVSSRKQTSETREVAAKEASKAASLEGRIAEGEKARSQLQAKLDAALAASAQGQARIDAQARSREASAQAARNAQLDASDAKLSKALAAEQAMKDQASALATQLEGLRRDVGVKAAAIAALRGDVASAAAEKSAGNRAAQAKLDEVTHRLTMERETVGRLSDGLAAAEQKLAALPTASIRVAPPISNAIAPAGVPAPAANPETRPQAGEDPERRPVPSRPAQRSADRTQTHGSVLASASVEAPAKVQAAVARAGKLLDDGDISGARLLLEWAVKADSGRAALLLGDTYNPSFLAKLHTIGVRGDVARANDLYRAAAKAGVPEAEQRLRP